MVHPQHGMPQGFVCKTLESAHHHAIEDPVPAHCFFFWTENNSKQQVVTSPTAPFQHIQFKDKKTHAVPSICVEGLVCWCMLWHLGTRSVLLLLLYKMYYIDLHSIFFTKIISIIDILFILQDIAGYYIYIFIYIYIILLYHYIILYNYTVYIWHFQDGVDKSPPAEALWQSLAVVVCPFRSTEFVHPGHRWSLGFPSWQWDWKSE